MSTVPTLRITDSLSVFGLLVSGTVAGTVMFAVEHLVKLLQFKNVGRKLSIRKGVKDCHWTNSIELGQQQKLS